MDDAEVIKQKINIVDLISEYLPLKKAGVNFKAPCPFHQEKTPSFIVSPERQIFHCFGCFPPGELIKTPFGCHKIEELDKNHWVVSGKGNLQKISTVMVRDYENDLVSVVLRKLGNKVRLTGDHNVFIVRGAPYTQKQYKNFSRRYKKYLKIRNINPEKYYRLVEQYFPIKKVPARELKKGDLLLYPIRRNEVEISHLDLTFYLTKTSNLGPIPKKTPLRLKITDGLLKLIGYWIAEGSNHRAYIRFSLGNHEEEFAKEIISLIKNIFDLEGKIYRRPNLTKTGLEITICQSQLANIFENLCGKGAENKHIPFIFQELPSSKQKILLEAIFKGDGHTFIANQSQNRHKSITTVSAILAEQIVDILLRLNLFPTLHIEQAKTDKLLVHHKQSYSVIWSEEAKQKYSAIYYQPDGSEYWLLPITKLIQEIYKGSVYNLTIPQDHSYIASTFAVANCGVGGDIFKFLMLKEGMEFVEALEFLAKKAGVTLTRKRSAEKDKKSRLFEANQKACQYYHYILTKHKLGLKALEYLKKRGLTDQTIKEFNLGYAPNSWDSLVKFLTKRGFTHQELIDSGLTVASKSGGYDRFRGRVMFPLMDVKEQIIAFSGRVLGAGEPKYINTPQTLIFDKSNCLFGINLAKGEIRQKNAGILTEGEMDMIMSYQSGVKNVVASKGTALTAGQIELIKKYTDTILLCFDKDLAGDSASRRGIEMADLAGLNIKVIQIPEGKDPAELALKNIDLWKKAVEKAEPIYDYYLKSISERFNRNTAEGKKKIAFELVPIWAKISDNITREFYIQKLSALIAIPEDILRREISKVRTGVVPTFENIIKTEGEGKEISKSRRGLLEEYLMTLLLKIPADLTFVPNFPETIFTLESYRSLYVLLVLYLDEISFKATKLNISNFVHTLPSELVGVVDRLYLTEIDDKLTNSKVWQDEINIVVNALKKALVKASLEKLSDDIKNAESFGKIHELQVLTKRFRDLSVKLKNLNF